MTTSKSNKVAKVGTIQTLPELGNSLVGQVIKQTWTNENGQRTEGAYREFSFNDRETGETKHAINLLIVNSEHGTIEVSVFGKSGFEAFRDQMYLDTKSIQWVEFIRPSVGDFVQLKGAFNQKFKKLGKSTNPILKAGFWNKGFKVLSPGDIHVRPAPEKPTSLGELKKREAAAQRHGAI